MEEKFKAPSADLKEDMGKRLDKAASKAFSCSFCGKEQNEVRHLFVGHNTCICEECIALCVDILREKEPTFCGCIVK